MIRKFSKIKNLGIFSNYTWDSALPIFERYNLIYGWNASGKTTLTSLFDSLGAGTSDKYPDLDYKIEMDDGTYTPTDLISKKIRVFNQDYITRNIQLLHGKVKPIFVLGEENKKIADQIDADEVAISDKKKILKNQTDSKVKLEKQKGSKFTDIARIISANTSGEATRKYNKRNAEDAFRILSQKIELSEEKIDNHALTIKQLEKESIDEPNYSSFTIGEDSEEYTLQDVFSSWLAKSKELLAKTVKIIVIERLRSNNDIYSWVEQGIELHNKHDSKVCEFCGQAIPDGRIKQLLNFFNYADKKLKRELDELIIKFEKCLEIIESLHLPDKTALYKELQKDYEKTKQDYETQKQEFIKKAKDHIRELKNKKLKTTESIAVANELDFNILASLLELVKQEIKKHNSKTKNFLEQKEKAQAALEKHYLSTIYDEVKDLEKQIGDIDKEIDDINNNSSTGINALQKRIDENYQKISSPHKACAEINKKLHTFLGQDELTFEPEDKAFIIKRKDKIANNLSEGEKTAIAFVYFTIHLKDKSFKLKDGIVIIDDPISSLDSNSLFQAFSFLKNSVKEAKQIFICTHNFDFLKLLLNWIKRAGKHSLYMIKNEYAEAQGRLAYLDKMDNLLIKHESEYHYLFSILYRFRGDGTLASVYHMPNLARKVLETFLMFRVPSNENYYNKLESLKKQFDENKLTAIYKFTNDQSHLTGKGFDPSLVPETQKCVAYILEMIKKVFPEHYEILEKTIN